jgi:hypothetical protein
MAKYDYGIGCPCGLYRECIPQCENAPIKAIVTPIKRNPEMQQNNHDFGFTFVDEESFMKVERVVDMEKVTKLRAMIMPLLLNLKKNPEKDIIQWPGKERIKSIDAFIKNMDELVNS